MKYTSTVIYLSKFIETVTYVILQRTNSFLSTPHDTRAISNIINLRKRKKKERNIEA